MKPITECKLWRWMGGMFWSSPTDTCPLCLGHGGHRWMEADGSENGERCPCAGRLGHYPGVPVALDMRGAEPDPTDPATVGCLLALVREAWACPEAHVDYSRPALPNNQTPWWVWAKTGIGHDWERVAKGNTEWDALCAALWAASERAP